jgi:excisionase family DNA binding protein
MTIKTSARLDDDLSVEQAAEMLRISAQTLMKKLDAGEIPFHYVASECRIAVADLSD